MAKIKRTLKDSTRLIQSPFKEYWNKFNLFFLYIGLGLLVIGYFLMSHGNWDNPISLTISPIILTIAYVIIIPLSILIKLRQK